MDSERCSVVLVIDPFRCILFEDLKQKSTNSKYKFFSSVTLDL